MYKISLINMPFANLGLPSIALTQLKSIAEQRFGGDVRVRILYLNLNFSQYLGTDVYGHITGALQANNSGLGDWLFRQIAFPNQPDNTASYFQRYFPRMDAETSVVKGSILAKRAGLKRYFERLVTQYQLDREDLVGFSSMFAQNVASMAMARVIKDRNAAVITVMGGANCESPMGEELVRHVEALDFVFSGPALISFPDLVAAQLAGDRDRCHQIRGVFSRQNVGAPHMQGHGAMGAELPIETPVPLDYESFLDDLSRSFPDGSVQPSLTFETSRGCWWGERSHCTFCGLNGGTMMYRAMPSDQALALFREIFEKYGDRCTNIFSVDNIMPRQYIKEVFAHLVPPEGTSIFYEVKADLKEWEMEVLSRAGVTEIQPGIEALATSTLKLMGKGTTSFQNVAFLKSCLRYGIHPAWNLLIGFPREEETVYEGYLRALPLLMHLPPPAGAFPIRFDRYSPYYTRAAEYGLDLAPYAFYGAIYPFGEEALSRMAYYFEDRHYDADYLVRLLRWQERLNDTVQRWVQRWEGRDGALRAELRLKMDGDGAVVHDTRTGERVEHRLSALGLDVLHAARGRGLGARHLRDQMGIDEPTAVAELARLAELGLVFEEDGRFIGLVMDIEARAPDLALQGITSVAEDERLASAAGGDRREVQP
ncbi:MAG TPA: RiPP maturation radical SAM C-methyltransferase [Thermoanaerobaculia bacterium]|nr:RiPP maturation radical SAM C-methyltransferase [Thermoanaerobaculia bacterium]